MSFVPHTKQDIQSMLDTIGVDSIAALFDEIPESLLAKPLTKVPNRISEHQLNQHARELASLQPQMQSYLGGGAYEHHVPAACWQVASRGEYYTAYTPYQAEASQGALQLIFEFQTMISRLTGMDVANASLYDGATALAEALLMAIRIKGKKAPRKILLPATLPPLYIETVQTILAQQEIEIEIINEKQLGAGISIDALKQAEGYAALAIPYPDFFGSIDEVDELTDAVHQAGALVIAVVNPIALGLLKEPGQWGETGADIVVGEGQPLGNYLNGGGPYFGFMTTRKAHVRQMPGRIVGQSKDKDGNPCFTLTLQAREQHIRRSKATSNICTNQGLMVVAATIYMALLGEVGLKKVSEQCISNMQYLAKQLSQIGIAKLVNQGAYFHECALRLTVNAKQFVQQMAARGILAGIELNKWCDADPNDMLICVTETKSKSDLDNYVKHAMQVVQSLEVEHADL